MMKLLSALLLSPTLALSGCQTDVSLPMMQVGLFYEAKDVEVMSQLCGKGSTKLTYRPGSGAPPCSGTMSFDFVQHATGSKFGKRAVKYESTFELKNVTYTK